jgi:hypothetical protein
MSLPAHRIRLELDYANPFDGNVKNGITGDPINLPRGADIDFEIALFFAGVIQVPTNVTSVRIRVKASTDRNGTPLMDGSTSTISSTLTEAEWDSQDATKVHAKISFPAAQTALAMSSANVISLWMVIDAATIDGKTIPISAGTISMEETGANATLSPPTPTASYLTRDEVLALIASCLTRDNPAGETLTLRNAAGAGLLLRCGDNQELLQTKL